MHPIGSWQASLLQTGRWKARYKRSGVLIVVEEWIPIVMFVSIAVVLIAVFWFRYRARAELQHTVRSAMERGVELSPELVEQLGATPQPREKDLRLGVIWMSLAIALVLCGLAIPEPEALRGMLAAAAFPFAIGTAYLLLWFAVSRHDGEAR